VGNHREKSIAVRFGSRVEVLEKSQGTGHFRGELRLNADEIGHDFDSCKGGWLSFQALTRPDDERTFAGRVQLVPPAGLSIISDIDDTIKHSEVRNRRE